VKKSITIHDLEETLDRLIREKAKSLNLSLDKTVKMLLKDSLVSGSAVKQIEKRRKEFQDLFGAWSEADADEFLRCIDELTRTQLAD